MNKEFQRCTFACLYCVYMHTNVCVFSLHACVPCKLVYACLSAPLRLICITTSHSIACAQQGAIRAGQGVVGAFAAACVILFAASLVALALERPAQTDIAALATADQGQQTEMLKIFRVQVLKVCDVYT